MLCSSSISTGIHTFRFKIISSRGNNCNITIGIIGETPERPFKPEDFGENDELGINIPNSFALANNGTFQYCLSERDGCIKVPHHTKEMGNAVVCMCVDLNKGDLYFFSQISIKKYVFKPSISVKTLFYGRAFSGLKGSYRVAVANVGSNNKITSFLLNLGSSK